MKNLNKFSKALDVILIRTLNTSIRVLLYSDKVLVVRKDSFNNKWENWFILDKTSKIFSNDHEKAILSKIAKMFNNIDQNNRSLEYQVLSERKENR